MDAVFNHALVTGGAGFIGSHLVRQLLDTGIQVSILDNFSVGRRAAVDPRARLVEGDVRSPDAAIAALEGIDCVFHLAARVTIRASFEQFYEDLDTNVMGTMNLLRSLRPSAVRRFTLASSMAVYADAPEPIPLPESHPREPISPYGVGKWTCEQVASQVLAQIGVPFTALRYFNTFGPGQTFTPYVGVITIFMTRLLHGEPPVIFGDGEQRRDFTHVADIAAGTAASLYGPPGTYNLGTGQAISVNEVANLLVNRINPALLPQRAAAQPGELRYSIADISAARNAFGYAPARSLASDLDAVIDYIRSGL